MIKSQNFDITPNKLMKNLLLTLALSSLALTAIASNLHAQEFSTSPATPVVSPKNARPSIPNPAIDAPGFRQIVRESAAERESKRLTEAEFIKAMQEKGVIILDARSTRNFNRRHITGAVNLPFTEFTAPDLAKVIPKKDSKVLIYCNNNFGGSPEAFATKMPSTALNLSTYVSLRGYGYTNIYELGPLLEVSTTKIPFVGTEVAAAPTSSKKISTTN
jgi:Rhodanese-like domain